MLYCKLKIVVRITTPCCNLWQHLHKVKLISTSCGILLHLATWVVIRAITFQLAIQHCSSWRSESFFMYTFLYLSVWKLQIRLSILFFSQQGLETIKLEMEDVGEPLVDRNFGHGRYERNKYFVENNKKYFSGRDKVWFLLG